MKNFKILILIIQLMLYFPLLFVQAQEVPVATKTEEVKGFTMTLVGEEGREKAVISGSVANILPGGLIEILDVVARVFSPDNRGADTLIHSSKGIYNRWKNIIDTDQFVRINRSDTVITGTGLHWEPDKSEIVIHRNVQVEYINERKPEDSEDSSFSPRAAVEIEVSEEGKNETDAVQSPDVDASSSKSVSQDSDEVEVHNRDTEKVATVITAEGNGKLNYEDETVAVFKKKVEIDDKDANLKAHLMKMFFNNELQALSKVEAYGDVRIKQPERKSYCRKAVYFVDEDKIILTGNPRIVQGLDLYAAQKITIYDKGERVVFEPRAELVIYSSTEYEEMD